MGCAYRNDESCNLKGGDCIAAELNKFTQEYEVDYLREQECNNFKSDSPFGFNIFSANKEEKKARVNIKIFGQTVPYRCSTGGCSVPDSPDVDAELLQGLFDTKFGPGVINVEFLDILGQEIEKYPDIIDLVYNQGNESPIVTINDEILFIGDIPVEKIRKELERLGFEE